MTLEERQCAGGVLHGVTNDRFAFVPQVFRLEIRYVSALDAGSGSSAVRGRERQDNCVSYYVLSMETL